MTHTLITAPAGEPVTVEEARSHCRVDGNHEDELLYGLVRAAREHVEAYTGRALVTQTWELRLDQFPLYIPLLKAPTVSVSSIQYIDVQSNLQTLSASTYELITEAGDYCQPGHIVQAYNQMWPSARGHHDDVRIRYVVGYGLPKQVPNGIKAAIKLMTAHLYENREAVLTGTIASPIPLGVQALLSPFKVF